MAMHEVALCHNERHCLTFSRSKALQRMIGSGNLVANVSLLIKLY